MMAVVLVVVGAAAVGAMYALGIIGGPERKPSVAHAHLPDDCQAVVRVDIAGLLTVPAIASHVVPAIDAEARQSENAEGIARFLFTARLDPKRDLREMVVCARDLGAEQPAVVGVIGGDITDGGILDAIDKHGSEEEFRPSRDVDGLRVIETTEQPPLYITQAQDAALIVGNRLDLVKRAVQTGDAAQRRYQLGLTEQVVGIIIPGAAGMLSDRAGRVPFASQLKDAGRVEMSASLDSGKVRGTLGMPNADSAGELAGAINQFLALVRVAPGGLGFGGDPVTEEVLSSAVIESSGKDLVVTLVVPKRAIEEAAKSLARSIRNADREL
jgi:hypothetical protein